MPIDTDKVRAVIYGQAVGDALFLPVEFKSAKAIQQLMAEWQDEWPKVYRPTNRKGGVEVWRAGEFSDDTEMAICILDAYLAGVKEGRGPSDPPDLQIVADRFVKWAQTNGRGMGNHTWKCLQDALFLLEPQAVAQEVWEQSGKQAAPNGAVMRTAYVGVLRPWDIPWTAQVAADVAATTHADPRCIASAVAVSVAIAALVAGGGVADAIGAAEEHAAKHDPNIKDWLYGKTLEDLKLDEGLDGGFNKSAPIGFTYKALGASFWAIRQAQTLRPIRTGKRERFRKCLEAVGLAGGDTDTNCAIASAMLGAYEGMEALPPVLVDGLLQRDILDRLLVQLLSLYPR